MGRVKGRTTKVAAHSLVLANHGLFGLNFDENKIALGKLHIMSNNIVERNRLAGEITVIMKQEHPVATVA
ncbi:hypothetical protein HY989_06775 [Candidatus Micrarchaeota archaeon]|nr:hypothetical protein [Candidatus Micrarchaeota archaeon]